MFDPPSGSAAGDQEPVSSRGVPEEAGAAAAPTRGDGVGSAHPGADSPGDSGDETSAVAGVVATLPDLVGLDLAQALSTVTVEGQDPAELLEICAAWSRVASWAAARRAEALAEIVAEADGWSGTWADGFAALATEVAMRESVSRQAASRAVRTAVMLAGPLQATAEALHDGVIDPTKAGLIARTLEDLPFHHAVAVEDEILPEAGSRTPTQLGRVLSGAIIAVDPQGAEANTRAAAARRRVCHPKALPDGMASIYAVLPAGDAIALDLALDGAARAARAAGDPRTMDQLRADVLASVGADALRTGTIGNSAAPTSCGPRGPGERPPARPPSPQPADEVPLAGMDLAPPDRHGDVPWTSDRPEPPPQPPTAPQPPDDLPAPELDPRHHGRPRKPFELARKGGIPVRVHVTVPLSTLLGGDEAAELDGYGPIDAATARALARGGTWRRLVTDPVTGIVLDVGRTRYRPPADLDELVRLRDGTCFRPGCSTTATACELDHTTPWSHHGHTAWDNLGAGCATDHGLKTNGDFTVRQHRPGVFTWTSRLTGMTYRRELDGRTTVLGRSRPGHRGRVEAGDP